MTTVFSAVKPEAIEVDEYSVWEARNIEEITVTDEEEGTERIEYKYDLIRHDKDNYIVQLHDAIDMTNTQNELAMVDLAQMIIGGSL